MPMASTNEAAIKPESESRAMIFCAFEVGRGIKREREIGNHIF